jgi:hypothetical protein
MLTVYSVSRVLLHILLPIFPRVLGIYTFINVSETNLMMEVMREYFIDQEKYSYLILLHLDAAIFVGVFSLAATSSFFVSFLKHICAIFKVAR